MFDFHEKRKLRRMLYSKMTLIILAIIIVWLSFVVWNIYNKEKETKLKSIDQRNILEELKERETALKKEIDRLSTERGIEAEIRSKFEVGKDGEKVIIIVDNPEEESLQEIDSKKSFWQKISDWF